MNLHLITDLVVRLSRTGAGAVVMWGMVFLSIISVAVMIERFIFFTTHNDNVKGVATKLSGLLLSGDYAGARGLLEHAKGFETRVVLAALEGVSLGKEAVQELALSAQKMERLRFERGLAFLGTVGNNAPFIGLFGTVLEIVSALYDLGTQAGGNVGAGGVMATLSQALAATAVGLVVAIPAVAVFNFFSRSIKTRQTGAEALVHVLLAHMKDAPDAEGKV